MGGEEEVSSPPGRPGGNCPRAPTTAARCRSPSARRSLSRLSSVGSSPASRAKGASFSTPSASWRTGAGANGPWQHNPPPKRRRRNEERTPTHPSPPPLSVYRPPSMEQKSPRARDVASDVTGDAGWSGRPCYPKALVATRRHHERQIRLEGRIQRLNPQPRWAAGWPVYPTLERWDCR